MKRDNILYWISTGLLVLLMGFSAVSSLINGPDAQAMMKHLGYPFYFGQFLAVFKIFGVIALLVPGFPKIREWAYAGFTFDLIWALYSFIAIGTPAKEWAFFPVFFLILACSCILNRKRLNAKS